MEKPDGGPAFPNIDSEERVGGPFTSHQGMSLRDYFAIHSLAEARCQIDLAGNTPVNAENIAATAYEIADAMIKRRSL